MRIVNCGMFQFDCRYCVCLQTVTKMKKCKSLQHSEMLVLVWLCACAHVCVCWVIVLDLVDICCCFSFGLWVGCMWVDWWRYIIRSNHGCSSHFNGKMLLPRDVNMKKYMKKCNIGVLETCLLGYIPTCGEKDIWLLNGVCVVFMCVMLSSRDGGLFAKKPFEGRIS